MQIRRAACYIRVSTENQLENYSIEEQTERLKAYCKAKDWSIYKIYTDGGYSGGNVERPALQQLISDIQRNLIDLVVVYKLDRLSRSQKDTLTLIEDQFLAHQVDFVSMSENFDTSTAFGRAMIGILSVFAQLEKDQITERFTMGRIGRAKNGYYHGGSTAPTGYDYVNDELVINEYEAAQVKEVYDRFLNGYSINSIRKYMSENYTNKYGNWSSHTLVLNILRNSTYTGKVKFKGIEYDGIHQPIISEDVFNSVQKLLKSQSREDSKTSWQKTPFKACNLLTSLLICKHCGARYCGNHGKYVCYSRGKTDKRHVKDPNCKNKKWDIEVLDNIVKEQILRLTYDENYYHALSSNSDDVHTVDKKDVLLRISEIDKQIFRMIDLYQVGDIPLDDISKRIDRLKSEKNKLQDLLEEQTSNKLSEEEVKSIVSEIKEIFESGDISQMRFAISSLVEYMEIDNEHIYIHWRF